ncbi:unnamed protein product [Mytilus coruscus]|uniref:Uncharacterized protein n=1 Tax=Mytilus coruscus TaxID=42192 RepID=A0A6J8AUF6_MYTCO|nr:unnamed protein product [Mytilus coruscus]
MIHNEHIDPITTEPVPPNIHRSLGVDKLKLFAGIHIGIGVACMIACTVGLITNMKRKDSCCNDNSCMDEYEYSYDPEYRLNRKCRGHTTIMILYVTCLCLSLWLENNGDILTVSTIIDACAVIEMIVAITSATYCCCCSEMLPGNQQNVVIFNPIQERVIHAVTQFQGPPVNQYGVSIPQGYQQQEFMPNKHVQIMTQQSPSQLLPPVIQGQQIQHHNGMANVNLSQQPVNMQPKLEQQPNQGVDSQQQN